MLFMASFIPVNDIRGILLFVFVGQTFRCLYETSVVPVASDLTHDTERLAKAIANIKTIFHCSFIFGLAIGGFAAYYLSPRYIFMIDAATFVFSALLIKSIPLKSTASTTYIFVLREMFAPHYYVRWFHLVSQGFKMARRHNTSKAILNLILFRDLGYGILNPLQSWWLQGGFASVHNSLGLGQGSSGIGSVLGGVFVNKYSSDKISKKRLFYGICIATAVIELVARAWAYSDNRFVMFCVMTIVASAAMTSYETGVFVKYISIADDGEKGAMTGFFQFVTLSSVFAGSALYTLLANKLSINVLPFIALVFLTIALAVMVLNKSNFQDA